MRIYTPTLTGLSSQPRGTEAEPDLEPPREIPSPGAVALPGSDSTEPSPMVTDPTHATRHRRHRFGMRVTVLSLIMAGAAWLRARHQHA